MPDIDDVLGLMMSDADFKASLVRDPKAVLGRYDLSPDDLAVVAEQLADDQAALGPIEQRTSKAGLFALFSSAMRSGGAEAPVGIDLTGLAPAEGDVTPGRSEA